MILQVKYHFEHFRKHKIIISIKDENDTLNKQRIKV